ncbi:MAG TPA: hypothetical protein PLC21_04240 [Deltaproteobacteria bacterium]|nr:hypothetical protein [Deltaproteobacteria bacterium]
MIKNDAIIDQAAGLWDRSGDKACRDGRKSVCHSILYLSATSVLVTKGALNGLETFWAACPYIVGIAIVAVANLIGYALFVRKHLPREEASGKVGKTDLEDQLIERNLREGEGISLMVPGDKNGGFFIIGRDEYLENQ